MTAETTTIDMDELRHLAWASTVPLDGDYEAAARNRIEWLTKSSPEQWHTFALGFNWGDELDPLEWIVHQDQCDMATALTIFWRSEPGWDLMILARGETPGKRPESELIEYIAKRIASKGFKRRKIAWDPEPIMRGDYDEMKDHLAVIANPPWNIHPDVIRPLRGREVVENYEVWEARPEGVRNGFWLNLPPSSIITPNMVETRDQLSTILFYLFGIGAGVPMILKFIKNPAENWLWLMGLIVIMAWWVREISRGSSVVRSLIRENQTPVPQRQAMALYAGVFLFGAVAFLLYSKVLTSPDLRPAMTLREKAYEVSLVGASCCVIWYGLRRLAQAITYRYLFR